MVETVAGLAVLLVLFSVVAVFGGPVLVGLPSQAERQRSMVEIAQLQALLCRIGAELEIPYWWPEDAVELSGGHLAVRERSKDHTSHPQESPDLLTIDAGADAIDLRWKGIVYRYGLKAKLAPIPGERRAIAAVEFAVEGWDGAAPVLPFQSLPLAKAKP